MLFPAILLTAFAQQQHQHDRQRPYAGQEARDIKALSAEEVRAYLGGEGLGFAKAAELNSYPGPRHVIELAEQLRLSAAQRAEAERVFGEMRREAVRLGALIVEKERTLDRMFAHRHIDDARLRAATREIALAQGELRAAHLRAHLRMRRALTPEQVRKYDELRGYNKAGGKAGHGNQTHHGHH